MQHLQHRILNCSYITQFHSSYLFFVFLLLNNLLPLSVRMFILSFIAWQVEVLKVSTPTLLSFMYYIVNFIILSTCFRFKTSKISYKLLLGPQRKMKGKCLLLYR